MREIRETMERMKGQWTQLNYQDKRAILFFNWLCLGNTLVLMFVQIGLGEWSNGVLIETNDSYNSIAMFTFFVVGPIWVIYELIDKYYNPTNNT